MNWTSEIEEWVTENPLSLGDSWDVTTMSPSKIKIERSVSVAWFEAFERMDGFVYIHGRKMNGKSFAERMRSPVQSKKLIDLLRENCGGRV